ncbi:MAG: hypothetical protein LBT76_04530 [Tannerella sp.]|jgi:hypothetical protein|nr:hypothetical protein [Tannerella sp.]
MAIAFLKVVSDSRVMASGIKANLESLIKRGLGEAYANGLDEKAERLFQLNSEQEMLKGKLKEKTSELNALVSDLKKFKIQKFKIQRFKDSFYADCMDFNANSPDLRLLKSAPICVEICVNPRETDL